MCGSCLFIHSTFEDVNPACIAHPKRSPSSFASFADSTSHQSFAGRMTSHSASRATMPCCCPLTPTAAMALGSSPASSSAAFTATRTPSSHVDGSCSAALGRPAGVGMRPYEHEPFPATALDDRSYRIAFVPCVPTSTPSACVAEAAECTMTATPRRRTAGRRRLATNDDDDDADGNNDALRRWVRAPRRVGLARTDAGDAGADATIMAVSA